MTTEIDVNEIVFRDDLYPRFEPDAKTIQIYSENTENLPPIDINQNNILIDGYHRWKAFIQSGAEKIPANVTNTNSEKEILLLSIQKNSTHGLQLSQKDKKKHAIDFCGVLDDTDIVKTLSISQRTYREWTSNKRDELKKALRDNVFSLWLQCYTQENIAEKLDISTGNVSNILSEMAELPKMKIPRDFEPKLFNIWNYAKIENTIKHAGNIPQDIVEQLIYYYTEPLDVIFDPFGGGGVTIEACKRWSRRYYVSDIEPTETAKALNMRKHDITTGLPDDLPKPQLVFLDPPYWTQNQGEYTSNENDLSNMSLDRFYNVFDVMCNQMKAKMKDGGIITLIIGGTQWPNEDKHLEDHAIDIYNIFKKYFKFEQRIIVPYSTQQYNGNQVDIAKREKLILNLYRDLIIFRKINTV